MIRLALPAAITLVLVAGYVGVSGCNRSGEPRLVITLSERELSLPWFVPDADDDPGLQLNLEVARRSDPLDARNWLTEADLRSLGFALNVPAGAPEAEETYRRMPPRVAWVAFEYGGTAWRDLDRVRRLRQSEQNVAPSIEPTRLVPVDAALDFDELHARHPTGTLILRAVVAISFRSDSGGPLVYGYVRELVPGLVTVPLHLRPVIDGLTRREIAPEAASPGGGDMGPRYEADLAVGRLGIPYLRAIRRLGQ